MVRSPILPPKPIHIPGVNVSIRIGDGECINVKSGCGFIILMFMFCVTFTGELSCEVIIFKYVGVYFADWSNDGK